MRSTPRAYIGLGANLGRPDRTIRAALVALDAHPAIEVRAVSPLITTEPVGGPPGQPRYRNGAAELATRLSPEALLDVLLAVERKLGRERRREPRFGPRVIDLDLLLHGMERREGPRLVLPHPRLLERRFVLEPLAAIAPDLSIPGVGATVAECLARLERARPEEAMR